MSFILHDSCPPGIITYHDLSCKFHTEGRILHDICPPVLPHIIHHIHMYISHRAVCDDFRILMIYFPLILTYTFTQRAVYNM